MSQEEMANELERILEQLKTLDPTKDDYSTAVKNYHELFRTLHEELEACDSDLDHTLKRELEKAKLELSKTEEENRAKQAKRDALWGLVKIGASGVVALAAIVATGSMEQSTILSQKCFSFIRALMPKA